MLPNRRTFLQKLGVASSALSLGFINPIIATNIAKALETAGDQTPDQLAQDEVFWKEIKKAYTPSPKLINLNNGGVSPQPIPVQQAFKEFNDFSNQAPSFYMWRTIEQGREPIREKLANLAGCSKEEIAINRNSSEAIETVIFGLPLQKGDEVVLCQQDYPNMMNAWKQRAMRDGIVLKWLNFKFPIEDKAFIVKEYVSKFTEKTKLVHITHMINWNGQIMPVREIADKAKERNIEVLVDAAHSFAHFDYKIPDLNCDYWGTSLHKWLCAPFGTGMLYVKKSKIKKIYPLLASPEPLCGDIRKFESLGTRSTSAEMAIDQAIKFHNMIGIERKAARLRFLKAYWIEKMKNELSTFKVYTSMKDEFSCAIALIGLEGKDSMTISNVLYKKYRIHTVAMNHEQIDGVRITPNVYTSLAELDKLVAALIEIGK